MSIERALIRTSFGYIHYRASGQGDVVFLFHINQQSSALMVELIGMLGTSMRAIAIDYPSYGDSDHLFEQPSIHDYAACAIEVMDALSIDQASVLGEATGAAVAIECARSFPDRIDKVVLANCPYVTPGTDQNPASGVDRNSRPGDATGFPMTRLKEYLLDVDPLHAPMNPTQDWMDRLNTAQIESGRERWQAITALGAYDIPSRVKEVVQPTLVLVGEHFYYLRYIEDFVANVQNVTGPTVIEGARFCMTWEFADVVGKLALEFLS